jgi:hypothetical protein
LRFINLLFASAPSQMECFLSSQHQRFVFSDLLCLICQFIRRDPQYFLLNEVEILWTSVGGGAIRLYAVHHLRQGETFRKTLA